MLKPLFVILFACFSYSSYAVDCPAAKVVHLQVEQDKVLVLLENQNWHLVGLFSSVWTEKMYSALLAAQMANNIVVIRYPDGFDCSGYNLQVAPLAVRTFPQY